MVKVLVIKTSALGDILQVYPCIREIKRVCPDAEIDWVIESSGHALARTHPLVKDVIDIHTKKWRRSPLHYFQEIRQFYNKLRSRHYDLLFDFQGNSKSALIAWLARADVKVGFGKCASEWPARFVPDLKVDPRPGQNRRLDYLALVEAWSGKKAELELGTQLEISHNDERLVHEILSRKGAGKNMMVCPFSNWPNKMLSETALITLLKKYEAEVPVKFWIPYVHNAERDRTHQLALALNTAECLEGLSIPALQRVMQGMDLVITMDSMTLALAGESQVPTLAYFGPSAASKYNPQGEIHQYVQGECPYGQVFESRCPLLRTCKTGSCLHKENDG